MNKNTKDYQKNDFNFLKKKTPIAPQGSATDKGELASNFLKKSGN